MTIEEAKNIVAKRHGYESVLDGIRERMKPNNRYTVMELVHQVAEVYAEGQVNSVDLADVVLSEERAELPCGLVGCDKRAVNNTSACEDHQRFCE